MKIFLPNKLLSLLQLYCQKNFGKGSSKLVNRALHDIFCECLRRQHEQQYFLVKMFKIHLVIVISLRGNLQVELNRGHELNEY